MVYSEGYYKDEESLERAFYNYQQRVATATKTSILPELHEGNPTEKDKIDAVVEEIVDNEAGVEDDDGPNNNPVAKAAFLFPFRSPDAWPADIPWSQIIEQRPLPVTDIVVL